MAYAVRFVKNICHQINKKIFENNQKKKIVRTALSQAERCPDNAESG